MYLGEQKMAQIKDEKQYKAIMTRIDELFFNTDEKTPADDFRLVELDILSSLVEEYEQERYPVKLPTLTDTMNVRLTENNWSQKEMASFLGMTATRLNAILQGKVHPTFEQARTISARLDIDPAIVLA